MNWLSEELKMAECDPKT